MHTFAIPIGVSPGWGKFFKFYLARTIEMRQRELVQLSPERNKRKREHSSVGLEHLPYKQRVMGSNPFAPTKSRDLGNQQ